MGAFTEPLWSVTLNVMEWEQRLANVDEALAEFGKSDEEIDAICLAVGQAHEGDFADVDEELETLANGQISIPPLAPFEFDAEISMPPAEVDLSEVEEVEAADVQSDWEDDADTVYAPATGAEADAYAELQKQTAQDDAQGDAPLAANAAEWEDGNEEHTMIADIVEGEDGEFMLMVEEDDIEAVDDSGVEPVEGAEDEKPDKADKSLLKRLFSRG